MTKLMDLGPLTAEVPIQGGQTLTVYPISAEAFFTLMGKYNEIRLILEGKGKDVDPKRFMDAAPDTVAGVIACACVDREEYDTLESWKTGVNKATKKARTLNVSDQLNILKKVFEITFTDGPVPFVESIKELAGGLNVTATMGGKEALSTASQSLSKAALNMGTTPPVLMRGRIAPAALVRGTHKLKEDGRIATHDFWPSQGKPNTQRAKT